MIKLRALSSGSADIADFIPPEGPGRYKPKWNARVWRQGGKSLRQAAAANPSAHDAGIYRASINDDRRAVQEAVERRSHLQRDHAILVLWLGRE